MNNKTIKKNNNSIVANLFWRFGERVLAQGITLIVTLIIARILSPRDYGLIAIMLVFINLADVIVIGGFANALIQKKDCDDTDFSSVFFFNIVFSIIIYGIIFICAPLLEQFYGADYNGIGTYIRVLALDIPIKAVNSVQQSYVSRNMIFKRFFFATLFSTIGAGIIGVGLALNGFGVWALIIQYLFNSLVGTCTLWFTVNWRPVLIFSYERLKSLLSYGWKLLCAQLLDSLYNNIRTLIIGKIYNSASLAYYNRGQQFPGLIIDNINTAIMSVMFPAISKIQDEKSKVRSLIERAISISAYIIIPLMAGLAIIGHSLTVLLLTEKWLEAVPFLYVFCIIYALQPITKGNQQVIKALGHSDIFLKLEIIKKITGLAILYIVLEHGVMAIALGFALASIIGCFLDMYVGGKLVDLQFFRQLKLILQPICMSSIMLGIGYIVNHFVYNTYLNIFCNIMVGFFVYISLSRISGNKAYLFIIGSLKEKLYK